MVPRDYGGCEMKHFSLRELEAELTKTVTVTTAEIETEEDGCKGMYVFRESNGDKFMWSPTPLRYEFHPVMTVAEADGIDFLCPLCFEKNGGAVGTHHVMVTFADRNVPDEAGSRGKAGPTRWTASGTGLDDLVLTPSILLNESQPPEQGCHWHGFVGSSGIPPGRAG